MAPPPSDTAAPRPLIWAPDDAVIQLGEGVGPPVSLGRQAAATAVITFGFTWPLALLGFAAVAFIAPSVTNQAGIGRLAFWALQVAALITVRAVAEVLWRRGAATDAAVSARLRLGRTAVNVVFTAGCGWLVLALQGLTTGQIGLLTVVLIATMHLLPVLLARTLARLLRRRRA